ncbi:MAG: hypothetical protein HFG49_00640 [Lachnospiraceae bacterium]|nr:hypothetical protein [Lachnospiraceae bacterium]
MLTFDEFVKSFPTNACVKDSRTAKAIYEQIICSDEIRILMAELSDQNRPAILACGKKIETFYLETQNCDMDLTNHMVKSSVGRMISESLKPLGYTKKRQTPLPKQCECQFFTSGSVFQKTLNGTQRIIKKIVDQNFA